MSYWSLAKHAAQPGHIDFGDQQLLYEQQIGDRPGFIGFDRRFTAWLEKNPRKELQP